MMFVMCLCVFHRFTYYFSTTTQQCWIDGVRRGVDILCS